jgi:hypothetical protein
VHRDKTTKVARWNKYVRTAWLEQVKEPDKYQVSRLEKPLDPDLRRPLSFSPLLDIKPGTEQPIRLIFLPLLRESAFVNSQLQIPRKM